MNKMCGVAISRLGLSTGDFYELTPAEFVYAMRDQQEREKLAIEIPTHAIWESARFTIHQLGARIPGAKIPSREDKIRRFPWERERRVQPKRQSVDQMKHAMYSIIAVFEAKEKAQKKKPQKKDK